MIFSSHSEQTDITIMNSYESMEKFGCTVPFEYEVHNICTNQNQSKQALKFCKNDYIQVVMNLILFACNAQQSHGLIWNAVCNHFSIQMKLNLFCDTKGSDNKSRDISKINWFIRIKARLQMGTSIKIYKRGNWKLWQFWFIFQVVKQNFVAYFRC